MYNLSVALKLMKVLYVYLKQNNCPCLYRMLNTIELLQHSFKDLLWFHWCKKITQ